MRTRLSLDLFQEENSERLVPEQLRDCQVADDGSCTVFRCVTVQEVGITVLRREVATAVISFTLQKSNISSRKQVQ
jgi:hypothetical protein